MAGRKVNPYNFLVVLTVALGSFTYGFTVNVTGPVLGMPSFYHYFNLDITSTTGVIGAIPGCYFGGGIVGAVLGAWACERFGRRRALFATSVIGVLGGVLLGSAVHVSMILIGRALSGICSGGFQTIVPIYQSEISPAHRRGHMVGQHGFLLVVGASVATWGGLGCSFASNPQVQWRLALALSGLSPLILAPAIFWLPESPRWLITREYYEPALRVLEKFHKVPGDESNTLAREEYLQIRQQIELEARNRTTILASIRQPPMRKRMIIGFLTQFLLQCSGVLVTVTYQVILYNNLGITGWLAICLLAVYNTWSAVGNFTNALMLDHFGRKRLLLVGLTGSVFALTLYTIMVARYAGTSNRVGCGFGVFFVYLYTTFYGFCLDSTSYVYCSEIFPAYMRTTGMAVSIIGYFAPALLFGQLAPTAFATIGWKYYLIFILVPACGLPVIWLYFPETKQLSLEEIAALFGEEVALDITHMSEDQKRDLDEQVTKVDTNTFAMGGEKAMAAAVETVR
ncbi:uncharacterized protein A1O5_10764 [Cladophialophora psammophila CBS 110553]|uniref:Major facilitator superfamily (MFS) profile domain-containing protein n=1 Tax=Cladophialophora psammophila CBS 110553 TaxID=1182543 RepID=W9WDX4_9EURO|nr:uncharacterized protein A1O5_10764 [Cladophialophora psammophila CBS 110553]EXJ66148.1 hypothetical protein A1O5_10764 [Cladophialophora psammophila CBS 110553]